jgi:subtilisin family serine protease
VCQLSSSYSTIVGSLGDLLNVGDRWTQLSTTVRLRLASPPRVVPLWNLDGHFGDEAHPGIAVVDHPHIPASYVADQLNAELLGYPGIGPVLVEPGFRVMATSASVASGSSPGVHFHPNRINDAELSIGKAPGQGVRIAVLDSGDALNTADIVDFVKGDPKLIPATDPHGHGTAVAELIRKLRPHAEIIALRVLDSALGGESHEILAAFAYCLSQKVTQFHLVNASLTTQTVDDCQVTLGRSLDFLLKLSTQHAGSVPTTVAAAGNSPTTTSLGYPATMPDVVVALADDWNGQDAGYNVSTAGHIVTAERAYGGISGDPFGVIKRSGQPDEEIVGTSFAAAVITASKA